MTQTKPWTKIGIAAAAVAGAAGVGYALYKHNENALLFAEFRKHGDVNGDGVVDQKDINLLTAAFGSSPGMPNWNPNADLNGDGTVDGSDIAIATRNLGLTYQAWLKTRGYAQRFGQNYLTQTSIVPIKEI